MASRQEAGEGGSSSSFLDQMLRRPFESNEQERGAAGSSSFPSPSNSFAALVSSYDDLSGANPWQNLSTPSSPRDCFNTQHSLLHFQRDLVAEYPWMQDILEQQRGAISHGVDSTRSRTSDDERSPNGTPGHRNQAMPARKAIGRRREQVDHHSSAPDHEGDESEAFLYEEAVAAWYQSGRYLRPGEGLAQSALAATPYDHDDMTRNGLARTGWERPGLGTARSAGEMDAVRAPAWPVADAGATQSANSPDTSLSSETGGVESDDEKEVTRSVNPPGSSLDRSNGECSTGKRKTSEASGDDGDDSARISSEHEPKRTSSSGPRKRSVNTKLKPREPRYAIKTRTDVDIMDDGFKWRKYGQKAVKNSSHPRNYYRCTTPHCPVRKRVERSHEDAGLVITTYEGKHTHLTPGSSPRQSGAAGQSGSPAEMPRSTLFQPTANSAAGLMRFGHQQGFPEFSQLAALHQMRAFRSMQAMALQHSLAGSPVPGSWQRDSLLRAQHFLGLHDAAAFGSAAKQDPSLFPLHEFMTGSASEPLPYPFSPPPGSFLERLQLQQMMRAAAAARGARNPRPMYDTDSDLVRRVLEAEEQDQLQSTANPDLDHSPKFDYGAAAAPAVSPSSRGSQRPPTPRASLRRSKTAGGSSNNLMAQCRQQHQPPGDADPLLLNGLLQEMVDRPREQGST